MKLRDLREYSTIRAAVEEQGYGDEIDWAQSVVAPDSPEALWREYAWVVLNSGMRNQVAEGIWRRVQPVVEDGASASLVFGHKAKAAAIDEGWEKRQLRFDRFNLLTRAFPGEPHRLVDWCQALPWIGPITKWHLAKNLGVECAKPDRWLERCAATTGETVNELCSRIAKESGDRIATVDLVLWRACNIGLITSAELGAAA